MIDVTIAKMFCREVHIEFLDSFAIQHSVDIDILAFRKNFGLPQYGAQIACQVLAQHIVQVRFLNAIRTYMSRRKN